MIKAVAFLSLALWSYHTAAQVVNTEQKRQNQKVDGWVGSGDLGFSLVKNTREILQLSSRWNFQYAKKAHTLLLLNDFRMMRLNQDALQNSGFQHVRYNYRFRDYLIPEAFAQAQYNQVWKIDLRVLAGAGPRFQLLKTDSSRLYFGSLVMYEYEEVDGGKEYNRDFRLSSYLSAGWGIGKAVILDHITYFQPLLSDFADYRISSESSAAFTIKSRLAFKTSFGINYDTRPPVGLPKTFLNFINALSIKL